MGAWRSLKLSTVVLLALLLLFYGVGDVHCSVIHDNNTDRRSLLDFKNAIKEDPTGALLSWNDSIHYCMWSGVNCSTRHPGRVTALNLSGLSLGGQITPSLGNLTFLRSIVLSSNRLSGQLPPLNRLMRLETLYIKANLLQGYIPDALTNCSELMTLDLSHNNLVGSIPPNIGFLPNLIDMDLSKNNLTGSIPSNFTNTSNLRTISLAENRLEGSIPEELGKLRLLVWVTLGGNRFSGRIPTTLFNLSYLRVLDLSINMLSGTLPSDVGDGVPDLQMLFLGINRLEGHIPDSLGNASNLVRVDLSINHFTGQIPRYLGKLRALNYLNLDSNKLEAKDGQSWEFLSALSNCPLETLTLYDNQLHGVLPNSVGNLSRLQVLNLGKNNLFGTVPPSIGKLCYLFSLTLSNNNLTGTTESWIGALKNLESLDLEGNKFFGPIPYSLGNLTKLTLLYLSKNQFDGTIPLQVSNLKQLSKLYLSSNKLTGEIPINLDQCSGLITIKMEQNMLIGKIPTSLGNLKVLNVLNLSHNNLSGTIPSELNGLQQLQMLDLSYNHLEGQIPRDGVFEDATAISLVGNWGLCGGAPNLHLASCHPGSRKSQRQYYLIKILIPVFGFMSLAILIYFILTEKVRRRKHISVPPFGKEFLKVSHKDLDEATEKFSESNLIGKGSYGSVYKGKLSQNKMEVAVKVFDLGMHGADRSFLAECEALRNIQHRNLLPIITLCSTADTTGNAFKALVYEYMPNGNLDSWLHHKVDGEARKHLSLTKRISIALNIADVLDYLHNDIGRPIIHCDLKPSNILLDHDMIAYLGDFGIARFFRDSRLTSRGDSTIGLRGTIGYIAPEYAGGSHPSTCGDAYSFGVVLLEMFTGRRPTDSMFENEVNIINFLEKNFPDQIFDVIDICLQEECKSYTTPGKMVTENAVYQCLLSLLQIALSCTREIRSERMNMREAAKRLHGINASYLGEKDKYAS